MVPNMHSTTLEITPQILQLCGTLIIWIIQVCNNIIFEQISKVIFNIVINEPLKVK